MKRLLCRLFGHWWRYDGDTLRTCRVCGREDTLWYFRFPKTGEPNIFWGDSPDQRIKETT